MISRCAPLAATAALLLAARGDFAATQIDKLISKIEQREGFIPADTTVEKEAIFDRAKLLSRFPDPSTSSALDRLQKEIDLLAPRWSFPKGSKDARLDGFVRIVVERWHPGGNVMKSVMDDEAWHITKNKLGIPLERSRRGFVLYKMPSESLCRQHTFRYFEKFDGTGYQPSNGVRLDYARFQSCSK
ncbi:MAG: hypothetical protein NTV52_31660 [Acidobacteria bacterium]|nr:hypothetical protein [Acidobacteriota bacterium]